MADNNPKVASDVKPSNAIANSAGTAAKSDNDHVHQDRQRGGRDQRGGGRGRGSDRGGGRGRGRGRGGAGDRGGRHSKGEMGRGEWSRDRIDKRKRNDEDQSSKRQRTSEPGENFASVAFSKDEIAAEDRKPKRKVAVLIGYAGSGYKGMQINTTEKTIEGDLFTAFVAAGAISKANADDPKKSSLVRCARTDKGVHAAGNVISLKLIVEDPDVVKKINDALPAQIRVWGFERTNGAFSCYQTCDSRWYEYLIPTYSFLPPHPQSFLGKKLVESAEKEGIYETFQSRQEDVASFWKDAEETYIKPILDSLDTELRDAVLASIHAAEDDRDAVKSGEAPEPVKVDEQDSQNIGKPSTQKSLSTDGDEVTASEANPADAVEPKSLPAEKSKVATPLDLAIKKVKAAYIQAKKAYRISVSRRQRVQDALSAYLGTQNFHNYTIQKGFKDPSAKRVIRSFKVGAEPIIINDTEWLSLKVHGQSFMMHQIRKMVAMAALVVRCGCSLNLVKESFGPDKISIPKAPGLGLLLERPVFETYNKRAVEELEREKIDFTKYEKEIEEFKQREIYERIFRVEEADHQFHAFFHHIDHFRTDYFLWVTAEGIAAARQSIEKGELKNLAAKNLELDSEDEADIGGGVEEG